MKITRLTNADWACDLDHRKSVGAYCIYLGNNLISWSPKKQSVNAKSSAKSEYRALASASAEISLLQSIQRHLLFGMTILVPRTGSQSCLSFKDKTY